MASNDTYKLGLGASKMFTPLHPNGDDITSASLVQDILQAAMDGKTSDYFTHVNAIAPLYTKLGNEGNNAWAQGKDNNGLDVYYVEQLDETGQAYYITVAVEGLQTDADGVLLPTGSDVTINGVNYTGVGMVTQTVGYSNFEFAKVLRPLGIASAVAAPLKFVQQLIMNMIRTVATSIGSALQSVFQAEVAAAEVAGVEMQIADQAEANVAAVANVEEGAGAAAVGLSWTFFGACIILSGIFIALSYILHNSYHHLRIWNLTKYKVSWKYYFAPQEGQITSGPVKGDSTTVPISGASAAPKIPDLKGNPEVYYADLDVVSSHESTGIGYVLQLSLNDPVTSGTPYTVTVYYDIPFVGSNSTNLTFDQVNDLGNWYTDNQGNNRNTLATVDSGDAKIKAISTYDYLEGKHVVPSYQPGTPTDEAFYYQSLLVILEKDLKVSDLN
ncbi:hypothetical protein B0J12DRAFT_705172 [Macrophomina phaseolina]|uniref:Uncharacterized protein n=1 Tax=Macrophomina phaseolina TaxID=35725 RepID=A0ABQ8FT01_9PEZI|nr:hypothetical protein B0J12DRAFT_705172 [Macrophomina phaseolina]